MHSHSSVKLLTISYFYTKISNTILAVKIWAIKVILLKKRNYKTGQEILIYFIFYILTVIYSDSLCKVVCKFIMPNLYLRTPSNSKMNVSSFKLSYTWECRFKKPRLLPNFWGDDQETGLSFT